MYPIQFENITKSFDGREVLHNLSFTIDANKITAIIGKSGSGKSTILKIVNGLVKPSVGKVLIFREPINYTKLSELRLHIGYSVQGTGLFPHMTVLENITLLAKLNGKSSQEIEDRANMLMSFVDLSSDFNNKYPHQLSGGEQQRVGICRAMILKPEMYLLDEAFGALDPTTKNEIHRELLKIQIEEPRTIVFVTHDLREAFKLADIVIIIEKGIIQQIGSEKKIKTKPANQFVEDFLNSQD